MPEPTVATVPTALDFPDCRACQMWEDAAASWPRPCKQHYGGEPATAANTVRVHLADAPTDVLVWLVGQPSHLWWSVEQITAATAPHEAHDAQATVANALALLRQMGYVVRSSEIPAWAATVDGQNAVKEANP